MYRENRLLKVGAMRERPMEMDFCSFFRLP
jgi:hypothetical protein